MTRRHSRNDSLPAMRVFVPSWYNSMQHIIIWNIIFDHDIPSDSCCPVPRGRDPSPWGVDYINHLDDVFSSQGFPRVYGPQERYDTYWQICWAVDRMVIDCRVAAFADRRMEVVLVMNRTLFGLLSTEYTVNLLRVIMLVDRWARLFKCNIVSTEIIKTTLFSTTQRSIHGPTM